MLDDEDVSTAPSALEEPNIVSRMLLKKATSSEGKAEGDSSSNVKSHSSSSRALPPPVGRNSVSNTLEDMGGEALVSGDSDVIYHRHNSSSTTKTMSLHSAGSDGDDDTMGNSHVKTSRRASVKEKTTSLAMEALNFKRVGMVGREKETAMLRSAFEKMHGCENDGGGASHKPKRTCVWISGEAGTGKTLLASQLQALCLKHKSFYIYGKCDLLQIDEPLGAIKSAMESLCFQICALPRKEEKTSVGHKEGQVFFEDMQQELQRELSLELSVLLGVIPSLADVMEPVEEEGNPSDPSSRQVPVNEMAQMTETGEKIKYALRRFMNKITSISPVVLVCDDLQWSDPATRDILFSWISDKQSTQLLFCGIYRSTSIKADATDSVSKLHSQLERSNNDGSIDMMGFSVSNFTDAELLEMVSELLPSGDHQRSAELCDIISSRTHGNPFFVSKFIVSLVNQRLLRYDMVRYQWEWDTEQVRSGSSATQNIVELMKEHLLQSPQARAYLPLAACLGRHFSWRLLCSILNAFASGDAGRVYEDTFGHSLPPADSQSSSMEIIISQGFVEKCSNDGEYSFVHDRIQEASLEIIPSGRIDELKFTMGAILREALSESDLEANIFTVTSLLNARLSSFSNDKEERLDIVRLNISVGKKAIMAGAFQTAISFFEKAIQVFPSESLQEYSNIYIDLYSSTAECAWVIFGCTRARFYANKVLQLSCPVAEKVRVLFVAMDSCVRDAASGRIAHSVALEVAREIFELLGLKLPLSPPRIALQSILGMLRAKRRARVMPLESYDKLPLITDPGVLATVRILDKFTNLAYIAAPKLLPLLVFETAWITLNHGVCPQSGSNFAVVGFIMTFVLGDFEAGKYYLNAATGILEKSRDDKGALCRGMFTINLLLRHWFEPLALCQKGLLESYRLGMSSGDAANASFAMTTHLLACYHSGKPITLIDEDARVFIDTMADSEQQHMVYIWCLHRQLFQNLRDNNVADRTALVGTLFDESNHQPGFNHSSSNKILLPYLFGAKISICMYWREYKKGTETAMERLNRVIMKEQAGQVSCKSITFHSGICAFAASHAEPKYQRFGKRCLKRLSRWKKLGDPNVIHQVEILQAEEAWLKGKVDESIMHFEKGIAVAGRSGWIHEQALANDRLSILCKSQGSANAAEYHLSEAIRLYKEWGAEALALALEQRVDSPTPKVQRHFVL